MMHTTQMPNTAAEALCNMHYDAAAAAAGAGSDLLLLTPGAFPGCQNNEST
jgi:hypothetical protein